jgi:ankyrin repeat protein
MDYDKLLEAVTRGDLVETASWLDYRPDVNRTYLSITNTWETLLHRATNNGHVLVCELLIDRGADINSLDHNEETPLHRAAMRGYKDICELLLDRGANFHAKSRMGVTVLQLADVAVGMKALYMQDYIENQRTLNYLKDYLKKTEVYDRRKDLISMLCN